MTTPMTRTERIDIPLRHPVFDGHFPGHPIVPGSLLLDLVLAAWNGPLVCVSSVKFHRPVRPGESLTLCFAPAAQGPAVRFRCLRDQEPVCSGLLLPSVTRSP